MARQSNAGAICAALLATAGIACSPDTGDGFPDMSSYTTVDAAVFTVSGPPVSGASMLSPDGMTCWLSSYPMPEYASISCTGPRPDKGPGIWNVSVERSGESSVMPTDEEPTGTPAPPLRALHVLYYEPDVFCGADDATTACRVGEHGFVLTPTSTELF